MDNHAMKFLVDVSEKSLETRFKHPLVLGQLLTPLTNYKNAGKPFAIDNGAYAGFSKKSFTSLLDRQSSYIDNCLFVAMPDVVGSARRTLELWKHRISFVDGYWPLALVAQDGIEDLEIPWSELHAIFIGGCDPWKDSKAAHDVVRTAKAMGVHTHVGRVNTIKRYKAYSELGADTCDGSGIARFDHMLKDISNALETRQSPQLFTEGVLNGRS